MRRILKEGLSKEKAKADLALEIAEVTREATVKAAQVEAARALADARRAENADIARRLEGADGTVSEQGLQHLNLMSAVSDYRYASAGHRSMVNVHRACQELPKLDDVGSVPECTAEDAAASLLVATNTAASLGMRLEFGILKSGAAVREGAVLIPEVFAKPVSGVVTTKPMNSARRVFITDKIIAAVAASKGNKIPARPADRVGGFFS